MLAFALALALSFGQVTDPQKLAVEVTLKSPRVVAGDPIDLTMTLVNRGASAQDVVKPGDGSESNWREPWVHYSAERKTDKGWEPVIEMPIGRCGLYDANWEKDVVALAPGARLSLNDWIPGVSQVLDLNAPGTYRVTVHYAFGTAGKGQNKPPFSTPRTEGPMKGVAPFTVSSEPLTIEVVKRGR